MIVQNVSVLRAQLKQLSTKYGEATCSVIVGYTAKYALYVHENIEMKWRGLPRTAPSKGNYWDPAGRGQSKFLEQPARESKSELAMIIVKACNSGATLLQAIYIAALLIQRKSQLLVPVDFGNLKASAFTRKENPGE